MAVLKAAVLIYLAIVPVINAYPVAQTAENKGRGRSYPLIISQYSNVRNSKYNLPTTTTTTTSEAPSVVILKEKDDVESPAAISNEKVIHQQDQEDEVEVKKVAQVDDQKTQDIKVDESLIEDKKSQEEKTENKESHEPNLGSDSASVVDTKNESVLAASQDKEDSLDSKPVSPSNEEKIETTIKLEPEAQPESPVSADVATLTNPKEEVQVTSLAAAAEEIKTEVSADKPAALEEGERPQMEATAPNASSADSVAKQEEPITKGEDVPVPVDAPDSTQQEPLTKTTIVQETLPVVEVETPTAESTDAESSRSAILKSEKTKTSEFFEEDRSFKDRPEEILLAAFRQGTLDEQKILTEKLSDKNLDALNVDDIANEGIRLERDDKKTDKKEKEKEKEKYSVKASLKEKKPSKPIISSDDPVQEYDELTRSGRAKDETNTETTPVDKAVDQADDSEPVIIGLVPSNYPVILPSGESTLSDKIQPDETPKAAGEETAPVIIGMVPNNAPVILPNGESALSEVQPATEDKAAEAATQ